MQRRNLKRGFFFTPQCKFVRKIIEQGRLWCTFSLHVTGKGLKLRTRYQSRERRVSSGEPLGVAEAPKIWNILSFLSGGFPEDKVGSWKLKCSAILICLRRKSRWFFWMSGIIWKKWFLSGGFPEDRVGSWSAVLFWCRCRLPATSTHKPGPSLNNHLWASS